MSHALGSHRRIVVREFWCTRPAVRRAEPSYPNPIIGKSLCPKRTLHVCVVHDGCRTAVCLCACLPSRTNY